MRYTYLFQLLGPVTTILRQNYTRIAFLIELAHTARGGELAQDFIILSI